jgi:hypothetical protein
MAAFPSNIVESDDSTGTNSYAMSLKDYNEIFVKAHLHCTQKKISSLSLKRKYNVGLMCC